MKELFSSKVFVSKLQVFRILYVSVTDDECKTMLKLVVIEQIRTWVGFFSYHIIKS